MKLIYCVRMLVFGRLASAAPSWAAAICAGRFLTLRGHRLSPQDLECNDWGDGSDLPFYGNTLDPRAFAIPVPVGTAWPSKTVRVRALALGSGHMPSPSWPSRLPMQPEDHEGCHIIRRLLWTGGPRMFRYKIYSRVQRWHGASLPCNANEAVWERGMVCVQFRRG